jgi:formylglycine-generating enzyme
MRHVVQLAGLVGIFGFCACSSQNNGGGNAGGAGGTAGSTSTGGAAGIGGLPGAGGINGTGGSGGINGTPDGGSGGYVGADAGAFVPASAQSCAGGLMCNGESCCTSINVPGGTFPQGRSTTPAASDYYPSGTGDEIPEFPSTVSTFALDKYKVTVGRFRKFVTAYVGNGVDGGTATVPADGAGANPAVPGSGWQSAWNANLPATPAAFKAFLNGGSYQTWMDTAGANETRPINYVNWFEAFAFCIWDGGRLATESEWEYAAAGGTENRLYPWGAAAPTTSLAVYGCQTYPGGTCVVLPVGSTPTGNGRWGHADLAGTGWEWAFDWSGKYPASSSTDYAKISSGSDRYRVFRAGGFDSNASFLRAASRANNYPDTRSYGLGARCSRTVQ